MTDPTEDLFSGLDRPRPLPRELRLRLEEQLLAVADAPAAVPLGADLDERLRARLTDPVAAALDGIDAPLRLDPALRGRLESRLLRPRRRARAFLGAAAAVVLAVGGITLIVQPGTSHRHLAPRAAGPAAPSGAVSPTGVGAAGAGRALDDQKQAAGAGGIAPVPAGPAAGVSGSVFGATADTLAATGRTGAPAVGPVAGGTVVTLYGRGLITTVAVRFGPARASYEVLSDSSVRAVAPVAERPGTVDIVIRLASGATYRYPAAFRYVTGSSGRRHVSYS